MNPFHVQRRVIPVSLCARIQPARALAFFLSAFALPRAVNADAAPASHQNSAIPTPPPKSDAWIGALGGPSAIQRVDSCAETRVHVVPRHSTHLDEAALEQAGVEAVIRLSDHTVHLLAGLNAGQYAAEMRG